MSSPAHLLIVPNDATAPLPPEDTLTYEATRLARDAEAFAAKLRDHGDKLDGHALLGLRLHLREATDTAREANRLVDRYGHDWIVANGQRGRADIDGETYRATVTGSATSLKVADKARLTDTWFRDRLAPWLASTIGSEEPGDETDLTARLLLSLVVEKLAAVATVDFKAAALRDEWHLDASTYASPSSGAGPAPTFEKVDPARTTKEKPKP